MKKKGVIFVSALLFLSIFTLSMVKVKADTTTTIASKDSYVYSYNPDSNYGGQDYLIFRNYILGFTEAYLYFDFSDKPTDWTKAEVSIDMYYVSETFDVKVSIVEESWEESTIDWINKPSHAQVITTLTVSEGKVYKIDISNYIAGNGISICLNASDYTQNGYVQGSSSEGYFLSENAPQLIWTYTSTTPPPDDGNEPTGTESPSIDGFNITLFVVLSFIGISAIIVHTIHRQKK